MSLDAGQKLGPYEIVAPLGAGGMGEVYRARDTKLGRDVALKVLPSAFAADPERMARFRREAQVLASLNHSHIGAIYGFEDSVSVHALVMELIEGPTLADRIARGRIPLDEALPVAREIVEALEAAHERGIVHRDLKPANIKITPDGNVKVLDFGLAKAVEGDGTSTDIQNSPTISRMATQAGIILGTAAYMSPEQAKGKSVDRRTDIWAFGCVLFEMLTGKHAFEGETVADTLAAVIKSEPEWPLLPADTPQRIRSLLLRCLKKDPKHRLQSIGEARITIDEDISGAPLDWSEFPASATHSPVPNRRRAQTWAALAGALAIALAVSLFFLWRAAGPGTQPVMRSTVLLPENQELPGSNPEVALSPNGGTLAFVSRGPDNKTHLWLRRMNSTLAQPLEGTEGADAPFWSPDSRYIGFFANGKLEKIAAEGGAAVPLCDSPGLRGASWGSQGTIVYAPGRYTSLYKVSAEGGSPVAITRIEGRARTDRMPFFLPDGKHLLFYSKSVDNSDKDGIYSLDLDSGKIAPVLATTESAGIYVKPDYLVFARDRNLMAQRFDARSQKVSGDAVPIANGVAFSPLRFSGNYAFSDTGLMVYQPNLTGNIMQMTWFDSEGRKVSTVGKPGALSDVALSPKEDKAAVVVNENGAQNIWIYDLAQGVGSHFTFDKGPDFTPIWSPDGSRIVFRSNAETPGTLYVKPVSGNAAAEVFKKAEPEQGALAWSPDGKYFAFTTSGKSGSIDLWAMPLEGDRKPFLLVGSGGDEVFAAFSPDGHWLLYRSNESGQVELYVTRFPEGNAKWQVSSGGGYTGFWTENGKRIVYQTQDGKLLGVDVSVKNGSFEIGAQRAYFAEGTFPPINTPSITKDGKRVLALVPLLEQKQTALTLVTHWQSELKQQ